MRMYLCVLAGLGGLMALACSGEVTRNAAVVVPPPRALATQQLQKERLGMIRVLQASNIIHKITRNGDIPRIFVGPGFWLITFEDKEKAINLCAAFQFAIPQGSGFDDGDYARVFDPFTNEAVGDFSVLGLDLDGTQPTATQMLVSLDPGSIAMPPGWNHAAVEESSAAAAEPPGPPKPLIEAPDFRTWSSADGRFTVEAEFAGASSGKVKLRKRDGSVIRVEIEKLSEEDKAYISDRAKRSR